jgi:hypothetical protein
LEAWLYPYPACFAKKRLEGVDKKGLGPTNTEKRGCMWLKTFRASLQQNDKRTVGWEEGPGGSAVVAAVMSYYTS